MFELHSTSSTHRARRGALHTTHGIVGTPFFMPIATKGSVRMLLSSQLEALQKRVDANTAPIVLSNTYHMYMRPGEETLKRAGGLHAFMQWPHAMLTDSGGFQVFSLSHLRDIDDDGVSFQSHIDGSTHRFTPERSMDIQQAIGSDIWMAFDYFPGYPATHEQAAQSVARTTAWAKRSYNQWSALTNNGETGNNLFGIVHGSSFADLRKQSAEQLTQIDFAGYAVGGLAVGEPADVMYDMIDATVPYLPETKPRYLMGVGWPEQIVEAVKRGIDMFDCVLPTRNARHGQAMIHTKPYIVEGDLEATHYEKINLSTSVYAADDSVLDPYCVCDACAGGYTRAYIRHLFSVDEPVGAQLITIHNITFYMMLMKEIRDTLQQSSDVTS